MCRLLFYLMTLGVVFSMGLTTYLFAPLYSYYFLGNIRINKNYKYFFPAIICFWRVIGMLLKDKEYRKAFVLPLFSPPMTSPDPDKAQVSGQWKGNIFDCSHCIKCCLKLKCPLLDKNKKLCLSYNSLYWRYFNCGRFPTSQKQIEYYQCPKWEIRQ